MQWPSDNCVSWGCDQNERRWANVKRNCFEEHYSHTTHAQNIALLCQELQVPLGFPPLLPTTTPCTMGFCGVEKMGSSKMQQARFERHFSDPKSL